jgi:hypothetical protein
MSDTGSVQTAPVDASDAMRAAIESAVRAEMDQVVPHLVSALKRNDGVTELARRLDVAERRLADRDQRPVIARVHRLLGVVRRFDMPVEVRDAITEELVDTLRGAGYTEFGAVDEPFDPGRHEALDGSAAGGAPVVAEVFEPGLETLGEIVVRARVRVAGADRAEPNGDEGSLS